MLRDIYDPIDAVSEKWIDYTQSVLDSDIFLAGLGKHSPKTSIPLSMNVITDFARPDYLMNSQEMWDDPSQRESGDQFFSGILEEASLGPFGKYSREDIWKRISTSWDTLDEYLRPKIFEAYDKNDLRVLLEKKFSNANDEGIKRHLDINYPSIVFMSVSGSIKAGYFGGLDKYPLCADLMNSLAAGGVPTGWIGPPPENGGNGKDCLQVIHFGPKVNLGE